MQKKAIYKFYYTFLELEFKLKNLKLSLTILLFHKVYKVPREYKSICISAELSFLILYQRRCIKWWLQRIEFSANFVKWGVLQN